ncbi:MAG: hypothetical protein HY670_08890 [Chloroflexi bacterium]|nr:hypothetical protein [Chloroflexota bacterium]
MQIRKTYVGVKPELLYDELRDFVLKQGVLLGESKLETYSLPTDSSSFISRGTLVFRAPAESGQPAKDCLVAHLVGSESGETKLMLDINEALFSQEKVNALLQDIEFIFGSYEAKPRK